MKIKILTLLLLSSFILSALTAVPSKINYQGIITDIDGSPIVSTANTITALLYATELGGAALYTQSFVGVNSDTNGMYSVEVGDGSLQSVLEGNSELWLELIINEQTLSPRQKINSVPYALVAKAAESIVPGSDTDAAISANASDIQAHDVRINTLEGGATMWTTNASDISALQAEVELNPAKELVQYGFEENLFLSETTSESSSGGFNYAGSTHFISGTPASNLDISDRILLVAQNSAHQNGIYVVLHKEFGNAYIIRAEDFNSDEDVSLGIFTVIEKGVLSGEGFVLDLIAENFILDDQTNGTLGFSKFTNSALETRLDSLESQSTYWLDNYNSITNNSTQISNNATAITALQSDVDQNEADADAAIAALQAVDASSARQFVVDFGFTYAVNLNANIGIDLYNYGDGSVYSCEVGDTVLLTGQSNSSENGIYEITNVIGSGNYRAVSLVRSTNYDTAEELNEGDLVLIEKGESNGLAFMLGAISETFVLGNDALTWYRCGINTNQDIDFAGTVGAQGLYVSTPGGYIIFDGMNNSINSSFETRFDGNDVRFTNDDVRFENDEVRFQNNGVRFQNYGGVDFDTDVEFNSTVTAYAGVIVDNITIDGTEIDLSSGDLTVDVAGDIILDADGANIIFKDGGTSFGEVKTNSTPDHFIFTSLIQDKDYYFHVLSFLCFFLLFFPCFNISE